MEEMSGHIAMLHIDLSDDLLLIGKGQDYL